MTQQTHIRVVREWCISLGVLAAVSISRQEAELRLAAFVPLLLDRFPDAAFTASSLEHVAARCVKGFPTYGELAAYLAEWWREHRPMPPQIAGPAREAPPPAPRTPPTPEESAYVSARVQEIVATFKSSPLFRPPGQNTLDDDGVRRSRAFHLTPEQLDIVNPLPNGRKRADDAASAERR